LLLEVEIELRHVRNKVGLARLRLPRDQRGDRRNADAASDIAHQIKMPAALPICSWLSVPMADVATGTYMDDAPTPLIMMAKID